MRAHFGIIENCTADSFEFLCPKTWKGLLPSASDDIRHCTTCNRNVYLCLTDEDLQKHISQGHCVAVDKTPFDELAGERQRADIKSIREFMSKPLVGYIKAPTIKKPD